MTKHPRVIGTTADAVSKAEDALGFRFPDSFRQWLLENNGLSVEDIRVFPVFDERDPRKTWDSIVREQQIAKDYWNEVFESDDRSFKDLLAFADFGTGDYYCFDYSSPTQSGEHLIVHVSHETGERSARANTFSEFLVKAQAGEFGGD